MLKIDFRPNIRVVPKEALKKIQKEPACAIVRRAAISVLVVLSLACAMGDRPTLPPREKLDADYTYLLMNGEPLFRVYTPRREKLPPRAPTIELILD
jgi:hypothetical protein